ncbi:MAG TPA: hypothetical protein VGN12_19505 [Pirellulales bacterium]|jgi:hypothetical protein
MRQRTRTLSEKLDSIGERFQPFPNVSAGSYCSMTQSLRLDGFADEDVKAALRGDALTSRTVFPVLVHECQHMVDHLCTLFGRKLLAQTYDGMDARLSGNHNRFASVADLFRTIREIHRNDYFFELGEAADKPRRPGERWIYDFSTGLQLDVEGRELPDQPVFFVRFFHPDGGRIARVPMSVAALLEARAMAAEVRTQMRLSAGIADEFEKKMYVGEVASGLDQILYEPYFVKYTVAAHTAANLLGGRNLVDALEVAARLSSICLMMPSEFFDRVKVPEYRGSRTEDPEEAVRRCRAALRRRDRGYLFLLLVTNLAQSGGLSNPLNVVAEALGASALPAEGEVMAACGRELVDVTRSTAGGRFAEQYTRVLALGDACLVDGGAMDAGGVLTRLPATLPPLVLRQGGPYCHGTPAWSIEAHENWSSACELVTEKFREFFDACGLYRTIT